jgi:hypothetical protein
MRVRRADVVAFAVERGSSECELPRDLLLASRPNGAARAAGVQRTRRAFPDAHRGAPARLLDRQDGHDEAVIVVLGAVLQRNHTTEGRRRNHATTAFEKDIAKVRVEKIALGVETA